jgi:hypothetical protein
MPTRNITKMKCTKKVESITICAVQFSFYIDYSIYLDANF